MITGNLRFFKYGNSLGMRVFKELNHSDYATAAAENLILVDPTGEVPPRILEKWLTESENARLDWLVTKKNMNQSKLI